MSANSQEKKERGNGGPIGGGHLLGLALPFKDIDYDGLLFMISQSACDILDHSSVLMDTPVAHDHIKYGQARRGPNSLSKITTVDQSVQLRCSD